MKKEYVPRHQVDFNQLKHDLDKKRKSFSLRALGQLLNITHIALYYKLSGQRSFQLHELQLLAARLGENYQKYLKNAE